MLSKAPAAPAMKAPTPNVTELMRLDIDAHERRGFTIHPHRYDRSSDPRCP